MISLKDIEEIRDLSLNLSKTVTNNIKKLKSKKPYWIPSDVQPK